MHLLINIDVPDLPAAERLYRQAFGLDVGRRFDTDMVELLGAQTPIYLLWKSPGSIGAGASTRDYRRHWTPLHLDVVVEHLEPALATALAAGMVQESDIRDANWGRIVTLTDPFGHGWCLVQFVGRGYDEIST